MICTPISLLDQLLQLGNKPVQNLLDIHAECIRSDIDLFTAPSVYKIHMMMLLISHIFIVLVELKMQYSYYDCAIACIVCALMGRTSIIHTCAIVISQGPLSDAYEVRRSIMQSCGITFNCN